MAFDPAEYRPPVIEPVAGGAAKRPLWSVMIPTFNCADMLGKTLESVLSQDPGPEHMQIEVVDDCSTEDDPEAVVREIGRGRVSFSRKPRNGGSFQNFNTCIRRSRGHLIHLLHGDDWVLPGFYEQISRLNSEHPAATMLTTRVFFTDKTGVYTGISPRFDHLEAGGRDAEIFYSSCPLQFAGIVTRRTAFERYGGFLENLTGLADWECWSRLSENDEIVTSSEVLGCYRIFPENTSGRQKREAANIRSRLILMRLFQTRYPGFPLARAEEQVFLQALGQAEAFRKSGDFAAFEANYSIWKNQASLGMKLRHGIKNIGRRVLL